VIIKPGDCDKVTRKKSLVILSLTEMWQEMQMREMSHLGNDNLKYQRLSSEMFFFRQSEGFMKYVCLFIPPGDPLCSYISVCYDK